MYIVMTSAAKMPSSCWGHYRNVAVVQIDPLALPTERVVHADGRVTMQPAQPSMISERARGVVRVLHMGRHNVGKTQRCAYERTLAEAGRRAEEMNQARIADPATLFTWGGSA